MTETAESPQERKALRLAVVEDEGLMRDLLVQVLSHIDGFKVVGAFGSAEAAEQGIPGLSPDVVLLDIHLGAGKNGIELGLGLRKPLPELGFVLLSSQRDPAYMKAIPASQAGGWSYLHKSSVSDVTALERAIRGAAEGMVVLDAQLARQLMAGRRPLDDLSERARGVLELVAQGHSNTAIAEILCLAEKSVETILTAAYRQLGIDTADGTKNARVQATLYYLQSR